MLSRVSRPLVEIVTVCLLLMVGCNGGVVPSDGEGGAISISQLRALYDGYPRLLTEGYTIEGVVISNDRHGEFRHKVAIEDSSGGVIIEVKSDSLFLLHRMGDRLRVECRGLTLGGYGGSIRLGAEGTTREVEPLSKARWKEHYRTVGIADSLPQHSLSIGDITPRYLSTRLLLRGVRFVEAGEEWAPMQRDTTRHLVDCALEGDTLAVRLSGRSDFANHIIPEGECTLFGVLDYFHDGYQLLLASPDDVLPHSEK